MCDRSAWLEGFYLVFVFTMAQGFLATRCVRCFLPSQIVGFDCSERVYVLTARKKLALWVFSALALACVGMGLYMVFSPQTRGVFSFVRGTTTSLYT